MTKPFLAIVLLVAPASSSTARTDSVALLTLAESKIDQPLFAKWLRKAQHIARIVAWYLRFSPLASQGLQNAKLIREIFSSKVQVVS